MEVSMAPIEEIFCEIDDFCKAFFPEFEGGLLPGPDARRKRRLSMSAGEIMTIVVLFHLSHYRDFKNFYLDCVTRQMGDCFPVLLSYNRFVEVQGRVFPALCAFMKAKSGHHTGLYYVDSTTISVCRNQRINRHQTFEMIAERGKSSMGWFFGFKLHVVINHIGEIMAFCLTPGNTDDRKPVPKLFKELDGLAAGDKGYISKGLAAQLAEMGINFITKVRKNMKPIERTRFENFFLGKRAIVEAVIGQLKEICQIEHTRHRKPDNFLINILAALVAYTLKPRKPAINLKQIENTALIPN
jgi:DNA-binding TFAR19-related protein (PDSD5 family)